MRFGLASSLLLATAATANQFTYERLDKGDAVGLFGLARDFDATLYGNALLAHGELGKMFDLPVIMTTSAENGPNGPLPGEFIDWYPDAPVIERNGEVNAWDNAEFREAVIAANKSQIIIGGIATDVCTTFLALSLREAGYSVWANQEASATTSTFIRDEANHRMRNAGVHVVSLFAIFGELMRDWRNTPGALELWPYLDRYFPAAGMVARAHRAAVNNGTIMPGQDLLP
ncbi:hypothetical protein DL770_009559 [Monosporascus sp. CRB-9-2]|nr:hypothetical protein DL770_009559 [Monosporascus sp. CRB-9-2]